jgi:hypothetical protein
MNNLYKLLFILSALSTNLSVAQGLNTIKKDSIVKIDNSDLSLIYYKETTAVWHNFANFYVVEPTKNWFVYLHSAELLVEVDYKHNTFYAVVEDKLTGGYKRFLIGKEELNAKLFSSRKGCFLTQEVINLDTQLFDLSFNKIEEDRTGEPYGEIGLKMSKHNIIITDYKLNYDNSEVIESIKYPGEDSVNSNYHTCYVKGDFDYSISKSGIYNFKKREWLLPQNFNTIHYSKSELITNPKPTNLKELNSEVWQKHLCKWELKSHTYSSIEKIGSLYICRTKKDSFNQSSYIILDKDFKPIEINDFYNFDLVEIVKDGIKITPILSKPSSIFNLDFTGSIISTPNKK